MLTEEEEQKRLDLMMEIERLRALEAYQVGQGRLQLPVVTNVLSTCPGHLQGSVSLPTGW